MKIFITGSTGFIGSWVARTLLEAGHQLVALVRNPSKNPVLQAHPSVQVVPGDLSNLRAIASTLHGCDACVHLALGFGETPTSMLEADTLATATLLEICHQAGVKQFLYTSSTAAMGKMRHPMREDMACMPLDLYGATKAASEAFILGYGNRTTMRRNIIRPGYTFGNPAFAGGTTQPDNRFWRIVQCADQGAPINLIKHDGTQFASGAALARLYLAALLSDYNEQIWLGLGTRWVSWEAIAHLALAQCRSSSPIILENRNWGAEPMLFSVESARNCLGWETDAQNDLQDHVKYLISQARLNKPNNFYSAG